MTDINVPPRAFKVGDEVVCLNFGLGKVILNTGLYGFPIKAKFNNAAEEYTANGQLFPMSKRCLFHADENVKVSITEPVYTYKVTYKYCDNYHLSIRRFKSVEEFYTFNNRVAYTEAEIFIKSKGLAQNDK